MIRLSPCLLALAVLLAGAAPAHALVETRRDWMTDRWAGKPLKDEPLPPPSGWRLGGAMTFPWTAGMSLAYLAPGEPATYKVGGTWGIHDGRSTIAGNFQDYRLYGALVYYFVPGSHGGPYVETGLDVVKASGSVLPLNWPVVPHIGFGTNGWWGTPDNQTPTDKKPTAWDLSFSATANGVLSLEGGILF